MAASDQQMDNPERFMGPTAPLSSNKTYRFDHFEADRESYQLRRGGRNIKLERIPLELLFLLLEKPGKLISREEIAATLWKDYSFLDTERGINTAVRKIRRALGDDPHRQQFIETVVGKGYRFAAAAATGAQHLTPRDLFPPAQTEGPGDAPSDVRFRGFQVEAQGETHVLSCVVSVGDVSLGRIPIVTLELPLNVEFPLNAPDRLRLQVHGVGTRLTGKATQALQALCLAILQQGLRTRASDLISPGKQASTAELHDRSMSAKRATAAPQP